MSDENRKYCPRIEVHRKSRGLVQVLGIRDSKGVQQVQYKLGRRKGKYSGTQEAAYSRGRKIGPNFWRTR